MSTKRHKQKPRRRQSHTGAAFGRDDDLPRSDDNPQDDVRLLLHDAAVAVQADDMTRFDDNVVMLAAQCDRPATRATVHSQVRQALEDRLQVAWDSGWQPADIHRMVLRRSTKPVADFTLRVIEHQLRSYARDTIHPGWRAQIAELREGAESPQDPIMSCREDGMSWLAIMDAAARCLHVLLILPPVQIIGPRPGEWVKSIDPQEFEVDDLILTRVRMLLAKAESTPYEAEAETFTAGAASLIARHRISEAMLAASRTDQPKDGASATRIGVENPYEQPKVQLLNAVAEANSCKVVWSKELGFATVVGFPSDLSGVELLYTSLLLQATNTMTAAGQRSVQGAHRRSRSFRASFLSAFAFRIGERLQEATDVEERSATAEFGGAARGERLPALVERDQHVTDTYERLFPQVVQTRSRTRFDREGWHHGRQAADQADMRSRAELRG